LTQALAGSREVDLDRVTGFGGTLLVPGAYTLVWKDGGDGADLEVTIRSGKKVLASAPGRRVQLDRPAADDAIVYRMDGNGTRSISRILFASRKEAIEVGG
jgi:hypothetical protein